MASTRRTRPPGTDGSVLLRSPSAGIGPIQMRHRDLHARCGTDLLMRWALTPWQPLPYWLQPAANPPSLTVDRDGLSRAEHETRARAAVAALAGGTAPAS